MTEDGGCGALTREDVTYGYRLILGRPPESNDVIDHCRGTIATRQDLIAVLLKSEEFTTSNPEYFNCLTFANKLGNRMAVEMHPSAGQLSLLLDCVSKTWTFLGETRPHWSVLSSERFLPGNIDAQEDVFFDSGKADVKQLIDILDYVGEKPEHFETVTEFGCGLGRITNHLADTFTSVIACDISQPHLELAARKSEEFGKRNILYSRVTMPEFGMRFSVDLWYSVIVLQHNPPPVMRAILGRVFSLLRPGGIAIFQVPTFAPHYRFDVTEYLATSLDRSGFDMHVLPLRAIFDVVAENGCRMIDVLDDLRAGGTWVSNMIVVKKPE